MKSIASIIILLVLLAPAASAAVQGVGQGAQDGNGTGQDSAPPLQQGMDGQQMAQEQQQEMLNVSSGAGIQTQQHVRQQAQNSSELQLMVQERQQTMDQQADQLPQGEQVAVQNQNQVRLAVYAFTAAEALAGETGPQLSQHAQQINASLQVTVQAEEQIHTRSSLVRFFLGGDQAAADEILQQVEQNQNRLQEMNQLLAQCECDDDTKAMLQEQLQNIEQEQNRLQTLAQEEQQDRGFFGWLI
jgi:hypothetical protein